MCGINGLITRDNEFKRKIPALNRLIKHRGPDDEGFVLINSDTNETARFSGDDSISYIKNRFPNISEANPENYDVILAHRRLSIIDLTENGHGPMQSADGKLWITYNGEIYNYIELRAELESIGYDFHTATDTEVILNAYLHWGAECLSRFNGMWGFAIWDTGKKELFLARDRFGVKPLYYTHTDKYFAFSSEIKPLASLLTGSHGFNLHKIPYYIIYGNRLNTDDTYINNISSLKASHYMIYRSGNITVKRYYDINKTTSRETELELEQKIVDLLSDSIKLRFRSDVPVGTCLSGGFDSSSIVALSSRLNQNRLSTFSAVWQERECDESQYIDLVNEQFGCTPHKINPSADEFEKIFSRICYYQEVPTEGPGLYPQWYVMAKAKGNVTVLLDGQGGDEVFGGYFLMGAYLRSIIRDRKLHRIVPDFKHFMEFLQKNGIHSFASWLFPRQYTRIAKTKLSEKFRILNKSVLDEIDMAELDFNLEPEKKFPKYINNLSYHFITSFTIPNLLHYEDRSSMAHSIESRVPFLDYRLVELGINLSPNQMADRGVSRPLFRKALKPYLPEEIVNRRDKLGYPTPFQQWTRTILKDYISEMLLNKQALIYDYIDSRQIFSNLENHFGGSKDYSWEIWRLLSLENFLRLFKSNDYTKAGYISADLHA